jgi:hypothetical protein
MRAATFVLITVVLAPASAAAQTTRTQGPMVVEELRSGFMAAPDVKITDVNHQTSPLIGGYAGWVTDETFFIGGAGYWLADTSHNDTEMAYGGLVVHWLAHKSSRVGFGMRGLIGGGEATLNSTIAVTVPDVRTNGRVVTPPSTAVSLVRVRQGFFIAEPEAIASVRIARQMRLVGGVGYRFTGIGYGYGYYGYGYGYSSDRLNGVTGSVSLQIGPGGS